VDLIDKGVIETGTGEPRARLRSRRILSDQTRLHEDRTKRATLANRDAIMPTITETLDAAGIGGYLSPDVPLRLKLL